MDKFERKAMRNFEREQDNYHRRIRTILWINGYLEGKERTPGFKVLEHNGLTSITFEDAGGKFNNKMRQDQVKGYQEALKENRINLDFYDEDPKNPYLIG